MFDSLELRPPDAILGIMAKFRADESPNKVDLSVGVYQDETGNTPILKAVKEAEQAVVAEQATKSYVGIAGNAGFNRAVETLVFGEDHEVLTAGRVATAQTPGGSGALCVAGHMIKRAKPNARVYLSDPSWQNHYPLLQLAGLQIERYPYYDSRRHRVDFEGMVDAIERIHSGDMLLLHGCCHNPCGADLSREQWRVVTELCKRRGVVPFIDFAYQGLSAGLKEDAFGVRLMAEQVPELVVVSSCSKNLGLYRERVGAISIVSPDSEQCEAVASNLSSIARGIYSMPPDHGAAIAVRVFEDTDLRASWEAELAEMRERINDLRQLLVDKLTERGSPMDFSFIAGERGMFSFLGVDKEKIVRLREEFHVYMVESSRINIAGINAKNVDYVADSIVTVLKT